MFPPITSLVQLPERPKDIVATGKMGGYGKWMITEFKRGDEYIYKHQKFDWTDKGNVFKEKWYALQM